MNSTIDLSRSLSSFDDRAPVRIDVCASEPSPVYPAMFAAAVFDVRTRMLPRMRVVAQPSHKGLLASIEAASCTLAAMSASRAARAILEGLPAKIVCAAVGPIDYAPIEREPLIPWERVGTEVRSLPPRAVLVAPLRHLDAQPESVRAAVDAYWLGAQQAVREPMMLSVVLATELGLPAGAAELEARRAIRSWRMQPAVRAEGLEVVLEAIAREGHFDHIKPEWLLDERFVRADWQRVAE